MKFVTVNSQKKNVYGKEKVEGALVQKVSELNKKDDEVNENGNSSWVSV